jgi:uncharacterized membrane protein (DUF4010 family)
VFETARPFLLALALGLVIGIERERAHAGQKVEEPLGSRTFTLLALLGALAAHLESPGVAVVCAVFAAAIVVASYFHSGAGRGVTTEVAAMATFGLGCLAHSHVLLAAMLGVLVVLVLALKPSIHEFAHEGLRPAEVNAALAFLVIALVVLPLLPNREVDPWKLVNPFGLWLLFVLIAGIGFAGYIAVRALGPARGLAASGFFAGLVSSTAGTLSLSQRAREHPELARDCTSGIVLANVASAVAQVLVVGLTFPDMTTSALGVIGVPIALGAAVSLVLLATRRAGSGGGGTVVLGNPLALRPAATLALAFAAFLVIAKLAERWFGTGGVQVMAALGGSTDVHAVTLAVSALARAGDLPVSSALLAILLAFACNMVVKIGIVAWAGGRALFLRCAPPLLAMMAAAVAGYLAMRGRV